MSRRERAPKKLLIIATIILVLGLIATQVIPAVFSAQQLASNILLSAIPFVLIFVGILLYYISLITYSMRSLGGQIAARRYNRIMWVIIAGIIVGMLAMFQPWAIQFYTLGFVLLLIATLSYILWSHISPLQVEYDAEDMVTH
ncbi:MAG: hypothetical protein J5I90_17625 [Caldilineales bacterium]|nr:hypothetical protein [Caldilineales bacterium]